MVLVWYFNAMVAKEGGRAKGEKQSCRKGAIGIRKLLESGWWKRSHSNVRQKRPANQHAEGDSERGAELIKYQKTAFTKTRRGEGRWGRRKEEKRQGEAVIQGAG